MTSSVNNAGTDARINRVITDMVARARSAQKTFCDMGQQALDDAAAAVGWAIMHPERNRELAILAVQDTGLGNVNDKISKNYRKTLGLLRDLQGVKTTGIVARHEDTGIVEIARPVGVVAAITPSTNPAATPANKIINALKCGNAIIVAPSPKGVSSSQRLVDHIHDELRKCNLPLDLVQTLEAPISKALTAELMRQADLVVATGSQSNVHMAYTSGTPAFGVGAGNVAAIIDSSADLEDAAKKIMLSKTFDNATSCSSENSVVIVDAIYDAMIKELEAVGGVLLEPDEKSLLQTQMWANGRLSPAVTGKDAATIASVVGLDRVAKAHQGSPRMLLVTETGAGPSYPFSGEKLSPVLAVYRAKDFDDALDMVDRIYAYMGAGHSVSLHSSDQNQAITLGERLPVARVIVNQPHCYATGGNFDNGLPFSLSMGCGTWGGNNFSDNMNYRQYLNTTRVAYRIAPRQPTEEDLFEDYWERHGQ